MVSPKPQSVKEEEATKNDVREKKIRKKKIFRGETVADRLLASVKRMEEMRLAENSISTPPVQNKVIPVETPKVNSSDVPVKQTKAEKLSKPTNEIDDLSTLEWETSSEQSGV